MPKPAFGFGTYLREAFWRRVPVGAFGALPLNLMALGVFAVLGIANPGFWLLGAAVELGYLSLVASNRHFQKLIDAEHMTGSQQNWYQRVERAVAALNAESRERYVVLLQQCRRILGITESYDAVSLGTLRDMRGRSLNQMLWIFLRLLRSREVIADNLQSLDRDALEADIARLEEQLTEAREGSALARSLTGTLDIQRKRLENLARAEESQAVMEAELRRIEQQVELLREEAAVSGNPEMLSSRLDAVTNTMDETSRWMDANSDLFAPLATSEEGGGLDLPPAPQQIEES
jgi:exonuclease VII small subunit